MTFSDLRLHDSLLRAVAEEGYDTPTPIQVQAIPHVLSGADLMGCAQTGTGKTAAFALPLLHHMMQHPHQGGGKRPIRTLILAPTRELAAQINESFITYGRYTGMRTAVIFGGVGQNPQVASLVHGIDIVIATPGRLLDLMNQGYVDLKQLEHLILDEADNMLDMGFIHDIRKIISRTPTKRQTLMFSATMPREIRELADKILKNPVRVEVAPVSSTAETVDQSLYFVGKSDKPQMLVHYLNSNPIERVLVFTRTKHGADRVVKHLIRCGITASAIHGNKSQNHRVKVIKSFKSDQPPVLIATDIAARGLDIDNVTHVVNYELPNVAETYVHRIGRTGRAGATGIAVSFCDSEERAYLRDIEKLTKNRIRVEETPAELPKPPAMPHGMQGVPTPQTPHTKPLASHGHGGTPTARPNPNRQAFQPKAQPMAGSLDRKRPRGPNGLPQQPAPAHTARPAQPAQRPHPIQHQPAQHAPKSPAHPIHGARTGGAGTRPQHSSGSGSPHRSGGFGSGPKSGGFGSSPRSGGNRSGGPGKGSFGGKGGFGNRRQGGNGPSRNRNSNSGGRSW